MQNISVPYWQHSNWSLKFEEGNKNAIILLETSIVDWWPGKTNSYMKTQTKKTQNDPREIKLKLIWLLHELHRRSTKVGWELSATFVILRNAIRFENSEG